jgi:hypothetical protein
MPSPRPAPLTATMATATKVAGATINALKRSPSSAPKSVPMRVEITIVNPLFQEKHLAIEVPSFPAVSTPVREFPIRLILFEDDAAIWLKKG